MAYYNNNYYRVEIFVGFDFSFGNRTLFEDDCLLGCCADGTIALLMKVINIPETSVKF